MKIIHTDAAPKAIGPYSQAVQVPATGHLTFFSGQVPLDPATMELVPGGVVEQAEQVMKNLGAVIEAAGCSFADVVRCTIYLTDLGDFAAVNAVYAKAFPSAPPARATVQVAALPKGSMVEIDAITVR